MKPSNGFTLIELLVASVILFTSISIGIMAFQTNVKAVRSADSKVKMLSVMPIILRNVEGTLRNAPIQEHCADGKVLHTAFNWCATPLKVASPPTKFDPNLNDVITYPDRFVLYTVKLKLSLDSKSEYFEFQKLGWMPLMVVTQGVSDE